MEQTSPILYDRDWGMFRSGFRLRCFLMAFKSGMWAGVMMWAGVPLPREDEAVP